MIKQEKDNPENKQWCVYSEDGKKSLGCGPSEAWAKKRLQQVEFFKRQMEAVPDFTDEELVLMMDEEALFELAEMYDGLGSEEITALKEGGEKKPKAPFPDVTAPGVGEPGYDLPKNWTKASAEKYWRSIGGSMTACLSKIGGETTDPATGKKVHSGARFCAALKDYIVGGTSWRKGGKKKEGEMGESVIHFPAVKLGEPDEKWTDILMTGEYTSMDGTEVKITDDDIDAFVQNFEENTRGQDIPVTIDHPDKGGASAGWFRALRGIPREGKKVLQGMINWTPLGQDKVGNQEYRYISGEIANKVLRSASLVNFPAIKGLNPVALEEEEFEHIYLTGGEQSMSERHIDYIQELAERITNQVKDKLVEVGVFENREEHEEPVTPLEEGLEDAELLALMEGMVESKMKPVLEENEKLKAFQEEATEKIGQLMEERRKLLLREKLEKVADLGENKRLSPAAVAKLEEAILAKPTDIEEQVFGLVEALTGKEAVVELGERGSSFEGSETPEAGTAEFSEEQDKRAKKLQEENPKLTYKEAAKQAYREMTGG